MNRYITYRYLTILELWQSIPPPFRVLVPQASPPLADSREQVTVEQFR